MGRLSGKIAAVRSLARTWANELAPRNIRVNVVAPGPTDTAMMAAASDEVRETLKTLIPLGRMGRADDVASAVLFLVGDQSSFITGVELPVDGGMAQV
ncbi:SDR family oxidoreductase [Azospirillum sp. YIM B02556]|uniref:SDR family oxidoreductase n=1 Tax=Azospirillum endophyticum TaxID=2800326 RepID=A0ABS1F7Q9_9PROT|nr:SDR family oxidoreductase [Azospirillum endophyticum]MBK1839469.1 SDR family oxidoreductase [Azospirillum endophyticum]